MTPKMKIDVILFEWFWILINPVTCEIVFIRLSPKKNNEVWM